MIEQIIRGLEIQDLCKCGVYCIFHEAKPERIYVGSTSSNKVKRPSHKGFYKRFYDHLRELRKNKHHSKYLQNTVNKYGIDGVNFKILEICDNDVRLREQFYIDTLKPVYNAFDTVHPKGRVWTHNQRQAQRKKMTGVSLPENVYEKIRLPVCQYTIKGDFLKKYSSIKAAANDQKIDCASINKCAHGKRQTAGGFVWKLCKNPP